MSSKNHGATIQIDVKEHGGSTSDLKGLDNATKASPSQGDKAARGGAASPKKDADVCDHDTQTSDSLMSEQHS